MDQLYIQGGTYSGEVSNSLPNGRGTLRLETGNDAGVVSGYFMDGELNGQATYRYKNGDTFERQFWKLRCYDSSSPYFAERCCHCVYINLLGRIVK